MRLMLHVIAACLLLCCAAYADSFGLTAYESAATEVPTTTLGGGGIISQVVTTNGPLPVRYYSAPLIGNRDSVEAFDPNANGLFTVSASAFVDTLSFYYGITRERATASADTASAYLLGAGNAQAALEWVDTIDLGGLPPGTPVTLAVYDHFQGSFSFECGICEQNQVLQETSLSGFNNEIVLGTNLTSPADINSNQMQVMTGTVGQSLTLVEQLYINLAGETPLYDASADFQDTAYTNIVVLTPGATLSSASGIDYAPATVPEPSSILLLGSGLIGGMGVLGLRQRRLCNNC